MERHYGPYAALYRCLKWYQLDTIKPTSAHCDDRKSQVRIDPGVAVTREMFPGGNHSIRLQAANEGCAESRNLVWVFAIRPCIDDRIGWIVVNVQNRCISDVDSQGAALECRQLPLFEGKSGVACRADGHFRRRENGPSQIDGVGNEVPASSSKSGPCLEISPKQERNGTHALQCIQLGGDFCR